MTSKEEVQRLFVVHEKFIAGKEQEDGFEELQIRLVRSRPGAPEKVELRQWEKGEDGNDRVPSRHGLRVPVCIVPWLIEILKKIIPAESNSTENLGE
jgi:hypothetical protein